MSEEQEEWRAIPGWEGYEASSLGRIWRPRSANGHRARIANLKPDPSRGGRRRVSLGSFAGKPQLRTVAVLIAETFIGPKPWPDAVVRHLNDDPTDDRAANLAWGTQSDNAYDSVRNLSHQARRKDVCVRGHLLELPNLKPKPFALRGHRQCLACARAFSTRWYHGDARGSLEELADAYYAQIMRGYDTDVA